MGEEALVWDAGGEIERGGACRIWWVGFGKRWRPMGQGGGGGGICRLKPFAALVLVVEAGEKEDFLETCWALDKAYR